MDFQRLATCVKTVPLLESANLIVIDEGLEVLYARKLIAGWIQMWVDKNPILTFDLLLFSEPKSSYQNEPELYASTNVNICDYFTVHVDDVDFNATHKKDSDTLKHILTTKTGKCTVIIDCLTSLILFVGLSETLWFLDRLRKQVSQVICIYKRDFAQSKIPCIETLGTTYIRIEKYLGAQTYNNIKYNVELVHHELNILTVRQHELVSQDKTSYRINSERINVQKKKLDSMHDSQEPKIESSFRIEMNENEMKQRKETVLPYVHNTSATNTSKILYQPEDADDLDEEDPDDDLSI